MTAVWDFWIIGICTFICSRSGESAAVWSGNAADCCTASLSAAAAAAESAVAIATAAADSATDTTAAANATVAATAATCESLNFLICFNKYQK